MVKKVLDCNSKLLKRFPVQFYMKENQCLLINNETGL